MKGQKMLGILLILAALILSGIYVMKQNTEIKSMKAELEWYKNAIQTQNGWSKGYGSYNIVSFDGGEIWYNYEGSADPEATRNDGYHFLTPADTALVKHIKAWDVLTKYVEKNGPLDLSTEEQKGLMKDAGFEIKEKK